MAYKSFDGISAETGINTSNDIRIKAEGTEVNVPDIVFVKDATITRDGSDLVLNTAQGKVIVEEYYNAETAPNIVSPDGSTLTPQLVESFSTSTPRYASADASMNDESPIGAVNELSGDATITRTDGTTEPLSIGTPVFQGDIIETAGNGAANVVFVDETSFAVSEDTRLAIDEYVFDPSTNAGTTNFSVLKGMFVFTSGLIGREDPDDVQIETPVGSIGIRGTIIAGNVDSGEITVVEGAIVLNDFQGNEVTLANQFETAQFGSNGQGIQHVGQLAANDVAGRFSSVSRVAPDLFSSINDAANETGDEATSEQKAQDGEDSAQQAEEKEATKEEGTSPEGEQAAADAEGQPTNEENPAEESQNGEEKAADDASDQADQQDAQDGETQGEVQDGRNPDGKEATKEAKPEQAQDKQQEQQQQEAKENTPKAGADESAPQGQEPGTEQAAANEAQGQGQKPAEQPAANAQQPQGDAQGRPAADAAQGQQPGQAPEPAPAPAQQGAQNTFGDFGHHAGQGIGEVALNFSLGNGNGVFGNGFNPTGAANNPNQFGQGRFDIDPALTDPDLPPEILEELFNRDPSNADNGTGTGTDSSENGGANENTTGNGTAFAPSITTYASPENIAGAQVATIQGISNTAADIVTSVTLGPIASNHLEVSEVAAGVWNIYLKSGESLDYEDSYPYIHFTAQNAAGETYSDSFHLLVDDVDEGIHHFYAEASKKSYAQEGEVFNHDFSRDFHHEDDTPLTFSIENITLKIDIDGSGTFDPSISPSTPEDIIGIDVNGSSSITNDIFVDTEIFTFSSFADLDAALLGNYINSWYFDNTTGALDIMFTNNFFNDIHLEIDVKASDGNVAHDVTKNYELSVLEPDLDYSANASGLTATTTGHDGYLNVSHMNQTIIGSDHDDMFKLNTGSEHVKIMAGSGNDDISVYSHNNVFYGQNGDDRIALKNSSSAYNNRLHGGAGDDLFEVSFHADAKNNTLIGGEGDDTFKIENVNNKFLGGEGDDTFEIDLGGHNQALLDLQNSAADRVFDGNEGFDTLRIKDGGALTLAQRTLDFTNVDANTFFHDINRIDLSDSDQHRVVLNASDIMYITGHDNTLIIDGHNYAGGDDLLTFNNDSGKNFVYEGSITEDYDGDGDYDDDMNIYSNGDVTLIIDQALEVNGVLGGGVT